MNKVYASIATLFVAIQVSAASAATVTGDTFSLTVSENGTVLGTEMGVAGAPGADIELGAAIGGFLELDWLDGDTVQLDFFSSLGTALNNLTFEIAGLDFMDMMQPASIVDVVVSSSVFNLGAIITFDANSILIRFPSLSLVQAADGEILTLDVVAAVSGTTPPMDPTPTPMPPVDPNPPAAIVPLPAGFLIYLTGLGLISRRFLTA